VVYSDALKTSFAGVASDLILRHGPVSEQVARALAEGIRARTGASIGVGITGIAGPTPGEGLDAGKPAGLVFLAVADEHETEVKELQLGANDRDRVRFWSTQHALERIRRRLL
jgi:nicotinamide-nucleotide amidase